MSDGEPNACELLEAANHRERHVQLHAALDELCADFIKHTSALPSRTTLLELIQWSHEQTKNPAP